MLSERALILKQLLDSYEFLFNTLGDYHPETQDCWYQYIRVMFPEEVDCDE